MGKSIRNRPIYRSKLTLGFEILVYIMAGKAITFRRYIRHCPPDPQTPAPFYNGLFVLTLQGKKVPLRPHLEPIKMGLPHFCSFSNRFFETEKFQGNYFFPFRPAAIGVVVRHYEKWAKNEIQLQEAPDDEKISNLQ